MKNELSKELFVNRIFKNNIMIKVKLKLLFVLVLTSLFGTISQAQSIYFNYTDGTNAAYNLADIRKITFDVDLMQLHMTDGSIYSRNVSTIGHYQYNQNSVNVENLLADLNDWNLQVFPNPTSDELNLRYSLPKNEKITIALFDLQGKMILEQLAGEKLIGENQDKLDLRQIASGTYICRISGTKNSISKQIIKK
jgi:hypothetical protein